MRRKQEQEVRLCRDCAHAKPVTHEHLAHDGTPIFCTCEFERYYKMLRWPQPCKNYLAAIRS